MLLRSTLESSSSRSDSASASAARQHVFDYASDALQSAVGLRDPSRRDQFAAVKERLAGIADECFDFAPGVGAQPGNLDRFVHESVRAFPDLLGKCEREIELLHHLQRYGACYLMCKSAGDDAAARRTQDKKNSRTGPPLTIRVPKPSRENQRAPDGPDFGRATIEKFLAECQPSMLHLLANFEQAKITGAAHLQRLVLKSRDEAAIRPYLRKLKVAESELEVEALVGGLQGRLELADK
ncbi:unnamed protein product [Mycena citricolor]|uniref:Uncharacterized protein n=1 Tax=Mycena citricolor TaxID=2018698 RepID=A0AAD2K556_9AGAR|nr:unnamed protein product [Mycena citricolor]